MHATPSTVRAARTRTRIRQEDAARARWMAGRRKAAAKAGYRGPLTREELARLAAAR